MGTDYQTVVIFPDSLSPGECDHNNGVGVIKRLATEHAAILDKNQKFGSYENFLLQYISEGLVGGHGGGSPILSTGSRIRRDIHALMTDTYEAKVPTFLPFLFDVLVIANNRYGDELDFYEQVRITILNSDDASGEYHPWQHIVEVYLEENQDKSIYLRTNWLVGGDGDEEEVQWGRVPMAVLMPYSLLSENGMLSFSKVIES